jgi:uncharacterized repeat protein (TIGR03803 family)
LALFLFVPYLLAAGPEKVLYGFQGGNDGSEPKGGLIADAFGNLYGTTFYGGGHEDVGTIFQLTPPASPGGAWTETVLHSFSDLPGGWDPWAGLVSDKSGNLYGTTWLGGTSGDCGVVFKLEPATGTYTVIHNFACDTINDGGEPRADLTIDSAGNLYGTTTVGGTGGCGCVGGCRVVFQLSPSDSTWRETVLYNFPSVGSEYPAPGGTGGNVILDRRGNLYGTTFVGGGPTSAGVVFMLRRPTRPGGRWTYHVLHSFSDLSQGFKPMAGLTFDRAGNLYGTAQLGGGSGCYGDGCGVIFKLARQLGGTWSYAVLYTFRGLGDGGLPQASLTTVANGSLYGTTQNGGVGTGCSGLGCGVAFRLTPPQQASGTWTETVLHTFRGGDDGYVPWGKLAIGKAGWLYGVTEFGGIPACDPDFRCGTVLAVHP